MVQARIVANKTGTDAHKNAKWKMDQIVEAFTDPSTWFLFTTMVLSALPNGGITSVSRYGPSPKTEMIS
jgi:MFS transporter, ACS family, allantoate permease